jgi:hypothetical protein
MTPNEHAAQESLATLAATHRSTHEYVHVDQRNFRHLDLEFYDATLNRGRSSIRRLADGARTDHGASARRAPRGRAGRAGRAVVPGGRAVPAGTAWRRRWDGRACRTSPRVVGALG